MNEDDTELLQGSIINCNCINNRMTRMEAVDMVETLRKVSNMQAKNWWKMR